MVRRHHQCRHEHLVVNIRFADLSKVSFGNDHNRLDTGDAVMIGLHGADVSNH